MDGKHRLMRRRPRGVLKIALEMALKGIGGMPRDTLSRLVSAFILLLIWAGGAAVFFRTSLVSGFDVVNGAVGDSQIIVYVHEHLFRWLQGQASFGSPAMFYPQPDTLGYAEAFVLDLLPYAALRRLGADPFLSMQLTAILLSALCFFCTFYIFARQLGVQNYIALAAALLITFPNNLFFKVSVGHINFFDIYYVPLIALLVLTALKSFPQTTTRALALTMVAFALFAMLFATSYYVAWLLAFTVLIALVYTAIKFRDETRDFLQTKWRNLLPYFGAAIIGFAAAIVPFLQIYGPVLSVHPARDFSEYIGHAPYLYDTINLTGSNLIWGRPVTAILGGPRAASAEQALSVSPLMSTIFIAWAYVRRNTADLDGSKIRAIFVSASAALAILSWFITAKIGAFSAFWIPFHVIPGGSAIRAGDRIQLLCSGFVVAGLVTSRQRTRCVQAPTGDGGHSRRVSHRTAQSLPRRV